MKIQDLWTVLFRGGFYRGGGILMSAISGIDQALWDIKGKYFNVPVWQLMGGSCRDKMRVYSWVGGDRPATSPLLPVNACSPSTISSVCWPLAAWTSCSRTFPMPAA